MDDNMKVNIIQDIKMDIYGPSSAGGQKVNKTMPWFNALLVL